MLIVLETHCYVCMVTNRVDFEQSSYVAENGQLQSTFQLHIG